MHQLKSIKFASACTLAAALSALTFALATPARAAAPLAKTPAPAYYRVSVGDFEVTALNDGTVDLPVDKLLKESPAKSTRPWPNRS